MPTSAGFDLLETDDPKALAEFALRWNDLMELPEKDVGNRVRDRDRRVVAVGHLP